MTSTVTAMATRSSRTLDRTRSQCSIKARLFQLDAQQLDVDQSGGLRPINALTNGLSLLRTMLGLTDMAATAGITSQSWANVRNYLKGRCGMNLL